MSSHHHQVRIVPDNLLLPGENINNYRSGIFFLEKTNKKAAGTAGDLLFDLFLFFFIYYSLCNIMHESSSTHRHIEYSKNNID